MMITGYTKIEYNDISKQNIQNTVIAYENYKKLFKFPKGIKG